MRSAIIAIVLGLVAAPALVVFSPVYFPETLFGVVCAGAVLAALSGASSFRSLITASAIAAVAVFTVALVRFIAPLQPVTIMSTALAIVLWLFVPFIVGAAIVHVLRRRLGGGRGIAVAAAGLVSVGALGVLLMFMVAPRDAADAPDCGNAPDCPRTTCAMMAERRRFLALERVTQYGASSITCVYTAWAGIEVGTVYATPRSGATWDDGWWPRAMRFWTP